MVGTRRPAAASALAITDDLYFLPLLVVHHYVTVTGEHRPPRRASALPEVAGACVPTRRTTTTSAGGEVGGRNGLWNLLHPHRPGSYKLGTHGLPLMGTGDWNDDMNRVGAQGKGRRVWNG